MEAQKIDISPFVQLNNFFCESQDVQRGADFYARVNELAQNVLPGAIKSYDSLTEDKVVVLETFLDRGKELIKKIGNQINKTDDSTKEFLLEQANLIIQATISTFEKNGMDQEGRYELHLKITQAFKIYAPLTRDETNRHIHELFRKEKIPFVFRSSESSKFQLVLSNLKSMTKPFASIAPAHHLITSPNPLIGFTTIWNSEIRGADLAPDWITDYIDRSAN